MSENLDMPLSAFANPTHRVSVASQLPAAGALNAPAQERPARIQPPSQPAAQGTAPSGWWLLPVVAAGAAIWGLILWWLL